VSPLRQHAEKYLAVRRALGFKLDGQGQMLLQFVDHLEAKGAVVVTTELALAWATRPSGTTPIHQRHRLSVVRGFARHMRAIEPRTEVPAEDLLPARYHRTAPYLYSPSEVAELMTAARSLRSPMRAAAIETLIGLLAVTGMRVGEAIELDRDDVDLPGRLLVVRSGKNEKSRRVPLHPSTTAALADYAGRRDQRCRRPRSSKFLTGDRGARLSPSTLNSDFDWLRRQTGLFARSSTSRPPRLHDLRHTFALRTLLNWYRAGMDVQAQLPVLSTYLGHVDPKSTYWYFEAAPELLALAAERLEQAWERP
jgi:integrase/recombinase XerD